MRPLGDDQHLPSPPVPGPKLPPLVFGGILILAVLLLMPFHTPRLKVNSVEA